MAGATKCVGSAAHCSKLVCRKNYIRAQICEMSLAGRHAAPLQKEKRDSAGDVHGPSGDYCQFRETV